MWKNKDMVGGALEVEVEEETSWEKHEGMNSGENGE